MNKILVAGAGGAPSEGVIRSLQLSDKHEEIIGMGAVPTDLIMSHAARKYVVPYANDKNYKDMLMKVLKKEKRASSIFKMIWKYGMHQSFVMTYCLLGQNCLCRNMRLSTDV